MILMNRQLQQSQLCNCQCNSSEDSCALRESIPMAEEPSEAN